MNSSLAKARMSREMNFNGSTMLWAIFASNTAPMVVKATQEAIVYNELVLMSLEMLCMRSCAFWPSSILNEVTFCSAWLAFWTLKMIHVLNTDNESAASAVSPHLTHA
mmetsp:Transcript_86304/g.168820  ORF Transcript_86304/g.168820 Transcript_86304/m.168820 type:complete len:108 (-) Transcript_86304:574-897(-)